MSRTEQPGQPLVVGVDVGGTKIAAAVVDQAGQLYGRVEQPTDRSSAAATLVCIAGTIERAISQAGTGYDQLRAIGLGIPGMVDAERGIGLLSVNLGWQDVPVKASLEARFGLPCAIENDVRVGALGEQRYGAGQGLANLAYVSLGTGIAAGVILGGRLYRGSNGLAGEIGHVVVEPGGPLCACGVQGCLEAVASGPAIARRAREALAAGTPSALAALPLEQLNAAAIFAAAAAGDGLAQLVLRASAAALAQAVVLLLLLYDPQRIVFAGGVVQGGQQLLAAIRAQMQRLAPGSALLQRLYQPELLQLTRLQRDPGILGAAALVLPA